jgi:hypothetical protein
MSSKHSGRPRGVLLAVSLLTVSIQNSTCNIHRSRAPSKSGEEHNTLAVAAYVLEESSTYAAAVAQEDADRREEDGEEQSPTPLSASV